MAATMSVACMNRPGTGIMGRPAPARVTCSLVRMPATGAVPGTAQGTAPMETALVMTEGTAPT
jgi:hypothetical protein